MDLSTCEVGLTDPRSLAQLVREARSPGLQIIRRLEGQKLNKKATLLPRIPSSSQCPIVQAVHLPALSTFAQFCFDRPNGLSQAIDHGPLSTNGRSAVVLSLPSTPRLFVKTCTLKSFSTSWLSPIKNCSLLHSLVDAFLLR